MNATAALGPVHLVEDELPAKVSMIVCHGRHVDGARVTVVAFRSALSADERIAAARKHLHPVLAEVVLGQLASA